MLAKTPPMGFNTWNTFGTNISDAMIRETADAMVSTGLSAAGYEYLVIDDCWSEYDRDPKTDRIVPHKEKFPNGMKTVADYVHSKGLKFGMYSCAGVRTCADYPGSFDHEYTDAETFADWGVDFLKYDYCFRPDTENGPMLYRKMGMALRACGRDILYSACNWGSDDVWSWIRSTGAQMYRSTGDINDSFESFKNIALSQISKLGTSAPYCFNDVDMLTVGMYGKGNVGAKGCDDTDYKTQFALWCMFSAPLMVGCDIRSISPAALALLTNKELIAIDQDIEGRPAFIVTEHPWNRDCKVLAKHLGGNELALMFVNLSEGDAKVPFYFSDLGMPASAGYGLTMKNIFTGEVTDEKRDYIAPAVKKHDCVVYRCKFIKK
ncbi:MAG: glycoside hydrolase family 27 protein [Eubacteriales bacterium]